MKTAYGFFSSKIWLALDILLLIYGKVFFVWTKVQKAKSEKKNLIGQRGTYQFNEEIIPEFRLLEAKLY